MKSHVYTYKKVNYLYNIHDTFTAGIVLEGWEVKSLDYHYGDINVSFCKFKGKHFVLSNCKITPDKTHCIANSDLSNKEKQDRILLLNKNEKNKIQSKIEIKGYTCIPTKLYRNEHGKWKLDIALVTGKTHYDKRNDIKDRDIKRDLARNI